MSTKLTYNLPTWFEEKGYWLSISNRYSIFPAIQSTILYHKDKIPFGYLTDSQEVASWNWIPSMTSVIEAIGEFEKNGQ